MVSKNPHITGAFQDLLESAQLAKILCELITAWADADQSDAYAIMDEIVGLAQDNKQPAKAIAKALGEIS